MDQKKNYDADGFNVFAEHNHDILSEILIRVDPSSILKHCMLVSKEWLSMIITPDFRKYYLKKWKHSSSGVLGLLMYSPLAVEERRCPRAQFLPTSKLGKYIKYWNSALGAGHYGFFMSKSSKGGLLLFGDVGLDRWYVCKPILRGLLIELPPPPTVYERCLAYIRCDDDDGDDYMVILARQSIKHRYINDNGNVAVNIQTFCSRTGEWDQSTPPSLRQLSIVKDAVVDKGGDVIYWRARENGKACLAAWDVNGGRATVIAEPPLIATISDKYTICYGLCPKGSLLAATYNMCLDGYLSINIWALDDDRKDWNLLYNVSQESISNNNLLGLTTLFEELSEGEFIFASFKLAQSRPRYDKKLFVYDFQTRKLEQVEYLKYACSKDFLMYDSEEFLNLDPFVKYHPLTVLDLGIWPSPPSSMQLSN